MASRRRMGSLTKKPATAGLWRVSGTSRSVDQFDAVDIDLTVVEVLVDFTGQTHLGAFRDFLGRPVFVVDFHLDGAGGVLELIEFILQTLDDLAFEYDVGIVGSLQRSRDGGDLRGGARD